MNFVSTISPYVSSAKPVGEAEQGPLQAPEIRPLTIEVGIVVFGNAAAELADLARTLQRAAARLIQSEAQATPPQAAVVFFHLHNNGSTSVEPTAFGPQTRLTSSSTNLGYARAHNLLMSAAFADDVRADFYLAVNPDGMPHPDLLIEMVALARRNQGRVLVEASQFPEELPKVFDPLTLDTPWASGCCLLVPAPVFRGIGGFDESMFMYCEDVYLSWRARHAGHSVKHAPRALFHHRFNRPGNNKGLRRAHLESARRLAAESGGQQ